MPSDFTNVTDFSVVFTAIELDDGVDFIETNDGVTTITRTGYGEGGYGEGGYGGDAIITFSFPTTVWVDIDTP